MQYLQEMTAKVEMIHYDKLGPKILLIDHMNIQTKNKEMMVIWLYNLLTRHLCNKTSL